MAILVRQDAGRAVSDFDLLRPWGPDECAAYLGISKTHFLQAVRAAEGFPSPLPAYTYQAGGKSHQSAPEWAAIDVVTWRIGRGRLEEATRYLRNEPVNA